MYITDSVGKRRKITEGTREMGNICGLTPEVLPPTTDEIIESLHKRIKDINESKENARKLRGEEHNRVIELDYERRVYRNLFYGFVVLFFLYSIIYFNY